MVKGYPFCFREGIITIYCWSLLYLELLSIFHQRFGERSILFALFNMVFYSRWIQNKRLYYDLVALIFVLGYIFPRNPSDWRNPIGYLVTFATQLPAIYYITTQCTCALVYPAGSCCIMIGFANDIKAEMITLNKLCVRKDDEVKFSGKFKEFVKFHSTVMGWVWHWF